jgi:hypothetical protein
LMPAQYVKPYVKRGKNDAADAGGDLRGRDAANDALCTSQNAGAAKRDDASPGEVDAQPPAHPAFQFDPLSSL